MRLLLVTLAAFAIIFSGASSASAASFDSVICCSEGGLGLPACNQYTNMMLAQDRYGRWYRCYYWPAWGFGDWVPA